MNGWELDTIDSRVQLVVNVMSTIGYVPRAVVKRYQDQLQFSKHSVKVAFYKKLKAQCPEALHYFFFMEE